MEGARQKTGALLAFLDQLLAGGHYIRSNYNAR